MQLSPGSRNLVPAGLLFALSSTEHAPAKYENCEVHLLQSSSTLIPGDTVWRRCKARRVAILNDAALYFAAPRDALLDVRDLVYIVGWDIHSETRLVGASGQADDGLPEQLGPFLRALVQRRPALRINILVWDFVSFYAAERECRIGKV